MMKYQKGDRFARGGTGQTPGYYHYLVIEGVAGDVYLTRGTRDGVDDTEYDYHDDLLDMHYHLVGGPTWDAKNGQYIEFGVGSKTFDPRDIATGSDTGARLGAETIVTDPDTGGQKGTKLARFDLLPADALRQIAEHYGKGAEKYDDRNWEKGYDWSLSYAALQRHLNAWWGGEDIDAETGSSHLAAAAFHVMALLTFMKTHPEKDNRPR